MQLSVDEYTADYTGTIDIEYLPFNEGVDADGVPNSVKKNLCTTVANLSKFSMGDRSQLPGFTLSRICLTPSPFVFQYTSVPCQTWGDTFTIDSSMN